MRNTRAQQRNSPGLRFSYGDVARFRVDELQTLHRTWLRAGAGLCNDRRSDHELVIR